MPAGNREEGELRQLLAGKERLDCRDGFQATQGVEGPGDLQDQMS